jgi:hypothetical protein
VAAQIALTELRTDPLQDRCFTTAPSFMTKGTRWKVVTSVSGSPVTPMMSAAISGAMRPRSGASMRSAATVVAARIAWIAAYLFTWDEATRTFVRED